MSDAPIAGSQATIDGFLGIEIELPSGKRVTLPALKLRDFVQTYRLYLEVMEVSGAVLTRKDGAQETEEDAAVRLGPEFGEKVSRAAKAMLELLETFPKLVGCDELYELTPGEVFEVIGRFFSQAMRPTPKTVASPASRFGST